MQQRLSCFGDAVPSMQRSPYTEQHIMTVVHIQSCNSTLIVTYTAHQLAVVLHFTANRLSVPRSFAWQPMQCLHKDRNSAGPQICYDAHICTSDKWHTVTGNWVASQRFAPSVFVSAAFPGRTGSTVGRPGAARGSSSPHGLGGITHASTLPRDPMRASAIMEHQHEEDGSSSGLPVSLLYCFCNTV